MKVNQNISAVISNARLHQTEDKLTTSIERLSSGYKINRAKDNPAGIAISNKMRAQIKALDQSSQNASDGISVIQTADGALNETHAILQRMRELAVQAATDSMTTEDKEACQSEVEQLQKEVDRIATDTEFNSKSLLDGTQDYRVYPSVNGQLIGTTITNFRISDSVDAKDYKFTIETMPRQASAEITLDANNINQDTMISINGSTVTISASDTQADIDTKLTEAGEYVGVKVVGTGTNYELTTMEYGSAASISCTQDGTDIATKVKSGEDVKIKTKTDSAYIDGDGFSDTATVSSDGKTVTIRDLNGYEIMFEVDPEHDPTMTDATTGAIVGTTLENAVNTGTAIDLDVTDMGSMLLQVGAHENQVIDVRIPAVTCEALYIDDLNLARVGGADKAIAALDDAISQVSEVRSRLGAYQNRLEYAVSSLDGTQENMESAISRIMDTDMAEEMTTYANLNVLDQAAISVLTQANDMPQAILQMLD